MGIMWANCRRVPCVTGLCQWPAYVSEIFTWVIIGVHVFSLGYTYFVYHVLHLKYNLLQTICVGRFFTLSGRKPMIISIFTSWAIRLDAANEKYTSAHTSVPPRGSNGHENKTRFLAEENFRPVVK